MGGKPLTWQQVLAVVCAIPALLGAAFAFGANTSENERLVGMWMFWTAMPMCVGALLHHIVQNSRRDLVPDILSGLAPPQNILQLGDCHFWLHIRPVNEYLLLVVVAQNLRDGDGELRLDLRCRRGEGALSDADPQLLVPLANAEVTSVVLPIALRPRRATRLKFQVSGRCKTSGTKVRFARRSAATKPVSPIIQLIGILTLHFIHGGGTFLEGELPAGDGAGITETDSIGPQQTTLWSATDELDEVLASDTLRDFIDDVISELGANPDAAKVQSPLQ